MNSQESAVPNSSGSPLTAFTGEFSRTRLSPLYVLGLSIVALAMILLPTIYLALIGFVVWGVLYHLSHNIGIMTAGSGGGFGKLLVYLGPAVAGSILVFFMLKPLFAKRPKQSEPLSLDPAQEPLLFAFVERICRLVGAPMPKRIDVDCQVNASASLHRGLLSRDLVLTIGLPLAAGLNLRQFAGVLAHEFGHFAQGAGMRLTYVIRSVSFWFARVVYERDEWDVKLEAAAKGVDIRIGIILYAARGCVWLTRRILWGLMVTGNAISCFMLRQMEFDADSYETKLAGSDAFESTAKQLRVLNAASQFALDDVKQSWVSHRLPEDLPLLTSHKAGTLPADLHQKLNEAADHSKTGWFDTHPCDNDRNRAARALNEPGVFRLESPAGQLFKDFAATCKSVTRHLYAKVFELEFTEQDLINSAEALAESAATSEADNVLRKYYGQVNLSFSPLLTPPGMLPLTEPATAVARWREARNRCDQLRPDAEKASAEITRQQERLEESSTAHSLSAAGFPLEAKAFGLPAHATSVGQQEIASRQAIDASTEIVQQQMKAVDEFVAALRLRISLALQLAPTTTGSDPNKPGDALELAKVLAAVGAGLPDLHHISARMRAFVLLAENRDKHAQPVQVDRQLARLHEEFSQRLQIIQGPIADQRYPFSHARGQLTVAEYARYEKACEGKWQAIFEECNAHLNRLFSLHYRLLGRVLVLAQQAEQALELPKDSSAPSA